MFAHTLTAVLFVTDCHITSPSSIRFNQVMQQANQACLTILVEHFNPPQKSVCGVTGDVCLVFPTKSLLYSHLISYFSMENHFSEVKKTSNSFTYELQ